MSNTIKVGQTYKNIHNDDVLIVAKVGNVYIGYLKSYQNAETFFEDGSCISTPMISTNFKLIVPPIAKNTHKVSVKACNECGKNIVFYGNKEYGGIPHKLICPNETITITE